MHFLSPGMTSAFVKVCSLAFFVGFLVLVSCIETTEGVRHFGNKLFFKQSVVRKPIKSGFKFNSKAGEELEWWQTSVFYQIYPMSFKDSNGDGRGDLKGITSKVEHLADIGVGAVWLSPIFSSPMVDFGYDISNFTEINEIFGTMDDFLQLRDKLNAHGIQVILDFVPNHSSDQHPWFLKSIKREHPYIDYYVWRNATFNEHKNRRPPNNWLSVFGSGSAWEWNEERGQYYFHQFTKQQPDLNYYCEDLVKEMKEVLKFWLNLGVAGFRMDAVAHIFEDKLFRDEPYVNPNDTNSTSYGSLYHIHTVDQPEVYPMIAQFRKVLDEFAAQHSTPPRVILSEAYTDVNHTMQYFGDKEHPGCQMPFNFFMMGCDINANADCYESAIHTWMDNMPDGNSANWVMGNHDGARVATRNGPESVDAINMLIMLLPETAITYNGEEIGMSNGNIRQDQAVDVYGRDGTRTPFQWDDSISAGFSSNGSTWLPVNSNFYYLNVQAQKQSSYSHYHVYKRLADLRRTKTIQRGTWMTFILSEWVLALSRTMEGEDAYILVINLGSGFENVKLSDQIQSLPKTMKVHTASVNSAIKNGDNVSTESAGFLMRPKSALVLTTS